MEVRISPFKNLRIEINSDCNRRCQFCPRDKDETRWLTNDKGRKKLIGKSMTDDMVYSILEQNVTQGFNATVGFDFYNEPTMDPRLFSFLDFALSTGCPTEIVTNGDTLKKDKEYAKSVLGKTIIAWATEVKIIKLGKIPEGE